jgi:hypothetical protein
VLERERCAPNRGNAIFRIEDFPKVVNRYRNRCFLGVTAGFESLAVLNFYWLVVMGANWHLPQHEN